MKGRWFSVARSHLGVRDAAPAAAAPSGGGGTESRRGRVAVRRPALLNTPSVSEAPQRTRWPRSWWTRTGARGVLRTSSGEGREAGRAWDLDPGAGAASGGGRGWSSLWGRDGRADLFLCPEVRTKRALGRPAAPHTPGAPVTLSDVPGAKTEWSRTAGSQQVTAKVRPHLIIVAVSQVLAHVVCSLNAGI